MERRLDHGPTRPGKAGPYACHLGFRRGEACLALGLPRPRRRASPSVGRPPRHDGRMAWWKDVVAAEPSFAAHVRRCFGVRKHCTLATLRRDGSPRISGIEVEFADDGGLYLGMMPGSRKAHDLRRDPRLALHSPTQDSPEDDPSAWLGEAKIAGHAVETSD